MKRLALPLLALLLLAAPAFAVDGTVLINQNTVVNGLPGCPTGGSFPVIICQPGSYKLSGNLTVPAGKDAIDIRASNVTLDLNGFSILGPDTCDGTQTSATTTCTQTAGSGVFASGFDAITVRNGSIRGEADAISIFNGSGVLVERVVAVRNSSRGVAVDQGILRLNTAVNNLKAGVECWHACTIEANIASGNHGVGINAYNSTITNNTVTYNGDTGIHALYSKVIGNIASHHQLGMSVYYGVFGSNMMYGNTQDMANGFAVSQNNNQCETGGC